MLIEFIFYDFLVVIGQIIYFMCKRVKIREVSYGYKLGYNNLINLDYQRRLYFKIFFFYIWESISFLLNFNFC